MEILFTGQRFDALTTLHLFRMRWFHSEIGRFLSRDPLLYADGASAYEGGFVPSTTDQLGLAWGHVIGGTVTGGLTGFAWYPEKGIFSPSPRPVLAGEGRDEKLALTCCQDDQFCRRELRTS